ncbi:hypothetical protein HK101_006513 [Irineochytrium annulatum]|nr:hypothetical protein HK101_006513 [Irineochytrium annulatum]
MDREFFAEAGSAGLYRAQQNVRKGEYENKIRTFSHPIKVFNYFASQEKDGVRYMTVYDFMHSLLPYRSFHHHDVVSVPSAERFFGLADTDGDGLISFSEYLLFVTFLGTDTRSWRVSFKIFDDDGNGTITKEEFQKIMVHQFANVKVARMGSIEVKEHLNIPASGLVRYLFGKKGQKVLTFDAFTEFMKKLQLEVLKLEFHQFDVQNDSISLKDFGRALIEYGPQKYLVETLAKVDAYPDTAERVTFEQYQAFDDVARNHIEDLGIAYKYYPSLTDSSFTRVEFQTVMQRVTGLKLTDGQVDLLFHLFDRNRDGKMDEDEFYRFVIKGRSTRGLEGRRHIMELVPFSARRIWECIKE